MSWTQTTAQRLLNPPFFHCTLPLKLVISHALWEKQLPLTIGNEKRTKLWIQACFLDKYRYFLSLCRECIRLLWHYLTTYQQSTNGLYSLYNIFTKNYIPNFFVPPDPPPPFLLLGKVLIPLELPLRGDQRGTGGEIQWRFTQYTV